MQAARSSFSMYDTQISARFEEELVTELDDIIEITSIEEALALIDAGLGVMTDRQLVSTSEVTDLLLDVRALLSSEAQSVS